MAQLKTYHKEFIVKHLAMFERPSSVKDLFEEEYDITISDPQLSYYNPQNKQGGRELSQKWRHLFQETRDKFISGAVQIPIANKHYRLQQLQKSYDKLKRMGNEIAANQVLEQAAKEMGGAYGAPVVVDNSTKNFYQQVNAKIIQNNKKVG